MQCAVSPPSIQKRHNCYNQPFSIFRLVLYNRPIPPPDRFFLGTWMNEYPRGLSSFTTQLDSPSDLVQVSVILKGVNLMVNYIVFDK